MCKHMRLCFSPSVNIPSLRWISIVTDSDFSLAFCLFKTWWRRFLGSHSVEAVGGSSTVFAGKYSASVICAANGECRATFCAWISSICTFLWNRQTSIHLTVVFVQCKASFGENSSLFVDTPVDLAILGNRSELLSLFSKSSDLLR